MKAKKSDKKKPWNLTGSSLVLIFQAAGISFREPLEDRRVFVKT
jgi:hypothetical protein